MVFLEHQHWVAITVAFFLEISGHWHISDICMVLPHIQNLGRLLAQGLKLVRLRDSWWGWPDLATATVQAVQGDLRTVWDRKKGTLVALAFRPKSIKNIHRSCQLFRSVFITDCKMGCSQICGGYIFFHHFLFLHEVVFSLQAVLWFFRTCGWRLTTWRINWNEKGWRADTFMASWTRIECVCVCGKVKNLKNCKREQELHSICCFRLHSYQTYQEVREKVFDGFRRGSKELFLAGRCGWFRSTRQDSGKIVITGAWMKKAASHIQSCSFCWKGKIENDWTLSLGKFQRCSVKRATALRFWACQSNCHSKEVQCQSHPESDRTCFKEPAK